MVMTESLGEKAKDLAYYKIRHISNEIQEILDKWEFSNIDDFLNATKEGKTGEDAIDDAIELQNLRDTLTELEEFVEMTG
jgi:vacuolar-type H+-ATPase subunit C/Vma6